MSKWKWIAQDADGKVHKYDHYFPDHDNEEFITPGLFKKVLKCKQNPNFKETLINLETEDYEINDGILTRIPRKNKLDKLIANVKNIDKKAAKWINKNRYKLGDTYRLDCCFTWDGTKQGHMYWSDISDKLEEIEEQEPAKETLKYRVGLCAGGVSKYLMFAKTQECVETIESQHEVIRWLTDWTEVEV